MGNWIETTIGDQVTLQRGIDITKAQQAAGTVPVISSGGISSYHNEAAVEGPGVVLGRKGVVGSVYYVNEHYWPHDTTLWVKDFHGNNPRFVYYFFKNLAPQLASMDVGSANPTLNRNHVHPIPTSWPPAKDQDRIVDILGSLDDKIELNRRMNETLEAMARALFKSWFVDFEPVHAKAAVRRDHPKWTNAPVSRVALPNLAPNVAELFPHGFEGSTLGPIPTGWSAGSLVDHAFLLSGGTPKTDRPEYWGGGVPWASAKDVSQCGETFVLSTERTITERGLENSSTRLIDTHSTVVVARGATTGRMVLFGMRIAMNQTCYALRSKKGNHFYIYCQARHAIGGLVHSAHGSVFDTVTTRTFETTPVLVPDPSAAEAFDMAVQPLFSQILARQQESVSLAAIRDALLPKLLSGGIRVGGIHGIVWERKQCCPSP